MRFLRKHMFAAIAVFCVAMGLFLFISGAQMNKRCTEYATGTLVDYSLSYDSDDNSVTYFPVVKYFADRKKIEAVAGSGSGSRPYEIGEEMEIRYNPDDPYEFVFDGDKSFSHWGLYMIGVAALMVLLEVLSAKGIIKESPGYHYNPDYGRGGVTLNVTNIGQAVKMAKYLKANIKDYKNLSPEDREALMEFIKENPDMLNGDEDTEE